MHEARRRALRYWTATKEIIFNPRRSSAGHPGRSEVRSRSIARYRGVLLGGGFAGVSKFVSLLSVAISVPLTVHYLERERYGMWMTISSLLGLLAFADLGIGNGLISTIAALHGGQAEEAAVKRIVSSAAFILSAIALLILAVFSAVYPFISWPALFGVSGPLAAREAGHSVMAFVACFALGLPFSIVQRLQMGLQESWRFYIWQGIGSLLSLAGTLIIVELRMGVPWLVVVTSGGPVIASMMNAIIDFGYRRPKLRPDWQSVEHAGIVCAHSKRSDIRRPAVIRRRGNGQRQHRHFAGRRGGGGKHLRRHV